MELDALERDRETRIVDVALPAAVRRAKRRKERAVEPERGAEEVGSLLDQLQERLDDLYRRMQRLDRLAWWSLLVAALGVFLPWRTPEGAHAEAGIEGVGLLSLASAGVALVCIYGRLRRRRRARSLLALQLLATCLVGVVPAHVIVREGHSALSFGVVITALAGVVAATFALLQMVRTRRSAN